MDFSSRDESKTLAFSLASAATTGLDAASDAELSLEFSDASAPFVVVRVAHEDGPDVDISLKGATLLGRGAFGSVYRAVYARHTVAVKIAEVVAGRDYVPEVVHRFAVEVGQIARISHPNCVRFLAASLDVSMLAFVTEYCPNSDLSTLIHHEGFFSREHVMDVLFDIVRGMAYLHAKEIVHRDLKSDNVLLDANFRAKVADFGLATIGASVSGQIVCGTRAYMAPEAWLGEANSFPADVWSFGTLAWECLTRVRPSAKRADVYAPPGSLALSDLRAPTRPRSELYPDLLVDVIERAFSREPSSRPTFSQLTAVMQLVTRISALEDACDHGVTRLVYSAFIGCTAEDKAYWASQEYLPHYARVRGRVTGRTPLHIAVIDGRLDFVRAVLASGVQCNSLTESLLSPLALASSAEVRAVLRANAAAVHVGVLHVRHPARSAVAGAPVRWRRRFCALEGTMLRIWRSESERATDAAPLRELCVVAGSKGVHMPVRCRARADSIVSGAAAQRPIARTRSRASSSALGSDAKLEAPPAELAACAGRLAGSRSRSRSRSHSHSRSRSHSCTGSDSDAADGVSTSSSLVTVAGACVLTLFLARRADSAARRCEFVAESEKDGAAWIDALALVVAQLEDITQRRTVAEPDEHLRHGSNGLPGIVLQAPTIGPTRVPLPDASMASHDSRSRSSSRSSSPGDSPRAASPDATLAPSTFAQLHASAAVGAESEIVLDGGSDSDSSDVDAGLSSSRGCGGAPPGRSCSRSGTDSGSDDRGGLTAGGADDDRTIALASPFVAPAHAPDAASLGRLLSACKDGAKAVEVELAVRATGGDSGATDSSRDANGVRHGSGSLGGTGASSATGPSSSRSGRSARVVFKIPSSTLYLIARERLTVDTVAFETSAPTQCAPSFGVKFLGVDGVAKAVRLGQLSEADTTAMLDLVTRMTAVAHPNCVSHFGVCIDRDAGLLFLVAERLSETSLFIAMRSSTLERRPRVAIAYLYEIACALEHLHRLGLTHGSLKPENVVFDENGVLRLTSYGVRTLVALTRGTTAAAAAACPLYGAPETLFGADGPASAPADVWSFGVLAWSLFFATRGLLIRPYYMAPRTAANAAGPPGPTDPEYPPAILELISDCLAAEPLARPTIGAVRARLYALRETANELVFSDDVGGPLPASLDVSAVLAARDVRERTRGLFRQIELLRSDAMDATAAVAHLDALSALERSVWSTFPRDGARRLMVSALSVLSNFVDRAEVAIAVVRLLALLGALDVGKACLRGLGIFRFARNQLRRFSGVTAVERAWLALVLALSQNDDNKNCMRTDELLVVVVALCERADDEPLADLALCVLGNASTAEPNKRALFELGMCDMLERVLLTRTERSDDFVANVSRTIGNVALYVPAGEHCIKLRFPLLLADDFATRVPIQLRSRVCIGWALRAMSFAAPELTVCLDAPRMVAALLRGLHERANASVVYLNLSSFVQALTWGAAGRAAIVSPDGVALRAKLVEWVDSFAPENAASLRRMHANIERNLARTSDSEFVRPTRF